MIVISLLDFGAQGDARTDDSAALTAAFASGLPVVGGGPGFTYRLDRPVAIARSLDFDGQGCVIKPVGDTPALVRNGPAPRDSTRVLSGAERGSRRVVAASAVGISVGDHVRITADDSPAHDPESYPDYWGRVTDVSGNSVTLDRPLPVDYRGTVRLAAMSPGSFLEHARIRNVVFDGSACRYVAVQGQGARLGGFVRAVVQECSFVDFGSDDARTEALTLLQCLDATVRDCRFDGQVARAQQAGIYYSRNALVAGCTADGSAFGLGVVRCESVVVSGNFVSGRRRQESESSGAARSIRGIKAYGCAAVTITDNHVSDFESGIKVQACFRFDVRGNVLRNNGMTGAYTGAIALNVGSIKGGTNMSGGVIAHNIVEHAGGAGIGVTSDAAGGVIVTGNQVMDTQGAGIFVDVADAIIDGNRVSNWGLRDAGDAAVRFGDGASVSGNRFRHDRLPALSCLQGSFAPTRHYWLVGNVSESGNPLGCVLESSGRAAVVPGSTSVAIAHGLSRQPRPDEIRLTETAGSPDGGGSLWVDSIDARQFVVHCGHPMVGRAREFGWSVRIRQPFPA